MKKKFQTFMYRLSAIGLISIGLVFFQSVLEGWADISPTSLPNSERLISKEPEETDSIVTILKPATKSRVNEPLTTLSQDQGKKALGLLLFVLGAAAEEST